MELTLAKGKYVVAVSGGVDSVVLLDLLSKLNTNDYIFVIAHFNHGIRPDSDKDAKLVSELAKKYDMPFELGSAQLGVHASEDKSRQYRYGYLRKIQSIQGAKAILTAHHQDDLLETIALHIFRGTGRYGLTPMLRTDDVVRPLLAIPKKSIIAYAKLHGLSWNEDSTNTSMKYARNRLRASFALNLSNKDRTKLLQLYNNTKVINESVDILMQEVNKYLGTGNTIRRSRFVVLPFAVQCEYIALLLKNCSIEMINKDVVQNAVVACKTLKVGKKIDLDSRHWLVSEKTSLKIVQK